MRTKNAKRLWPCAKRPSWSVFALAAFLGLWADGSLATVGQPAERPKTLSCDSDGHGYGQRWRFRIDGC